MWLPREAASETGKERSEQERGLDLSGKAVCQTENIFSPCPT